MLVLTKSDLMSLLKPDEYRRLLVQLTPVGAEVLVYVCSTDHVYMGFVRLSTDGFLDWDRFIPSSSFLSIYPEPPEDRILPCPLCANDPSVVRMANQAGKILVYS